MFLRGLMSMGLLLAMAPVAAGEQKPAPAAPQARDLKIRVVNADQWKCEVRDVEKVLASSAGELWRFFPGRQLPPIEVEARGGPIVLFRRGPEGQIRVRLDTGDRLWAQMAYQFAHEFNHILCNYDDTHRPTKWFEESLCEAASLFALHRMAEDWAVKPPYPNWKSYAPSLKTYADERIRKAAVPEGKTFPQWYRQNADALRARSTDRPRNQIVAGVLLPILASQPDAWESVTCLNKEAFAGEYTFADHLKAWRRQCPEKHRAFVTRVAAAFGIALDAAAN